MKIIFLVIHISMFLHAVFSAQGRYAQKLLNDLMENYSNALRPVEDTDKALNVTLQITLSQIKDMDEKNQVLTTYLWVRQIWHDAYLSWDKDEYDGLEVIRIPSSLVWRPDIVLYNNADEEDSSGPPETNVVLRYNGEITWDSPAITKSSCKVDVSYFPFDYQQCNLTFGSWTYNGNQVDISMGMESGDLSDFVENVEWECHGMPAVKNVIMYGCCSDPYPDITYTLLLKRRSSFYIFNLLLPCFLISFLAPLGFYLPADSGEKVSLGVTVLLALTVFQMMVAESMPPSESVPLIGKYYIATMTMITASTSLTIFIMNIHFCGAEAKPVPHWAKVLIIDYMSKIFFVYEVGENCTTPESERGLLLSEDPLASLERDGYFDKEFCGDCHHNRRNHGPFNGYNHHRHENNLHGNGYHHSNGDYHRQKHQRRTQSNSPVRPKSHQNKYIHYIGRDESEKHPLTNQEKLKESELSIPEKLKGYSYDDANGYLSGVGYPHDGYGKTYGADNYNKTTICICGQHQKVVRNIEYISNCFREQRAHQAKGAEWKKIAKVMDRFFMWVFFIMVFLMSILVMAKAS
ncbi:neuronal acetylcholine receptor subunit alpha-9 [Triplophysa rosa]|uniref:Neuronal acetylcholine receptor subunit alpha-9 n=1 Tax=Triplophysa rosa TaxID=992332 RepID=A0A9W7WYY6_TRIRA|nr:neuronal acetylcholine receptor subunit alpha-9 [Triplophysa rosa]KAI7810953.1 putative neuronal acetylcholine receptor subunit alpha-9 [Triplophysa rosa]